MGAGWAVGTCKNVLKFVSIRASSLKKSPLAGLPHPARASALDLETREGGSQVRLLTLTADRAGDGLGV